MVELSEIATHVCDEAWLTTLKVLYYGSLAAIPPLLYGVIRLGIITSRELKAREQEAKELGKLERISESDFPFKFENWKGRYSPAVIEYARRQFPTQDSFIAARRNAEMRAEKYKEKHGSVLGRGNMDPHVLALESPEAYLASLELRLTLDRET